MLFFIKFMLFLMDNYKSTIINNRNKHEQNPFFNYFATRLCVLW